MDTMQFMSALISPKQIRCSAIGMLSFLPILAFGQGDRELLSQALQFDPISAPPKELAFEPTLGDPRPQVSSFQINYHAFLSNELGERYALVTVSKSTASSSEFGTQDVIAVLASGQRIFPIRIEGERRITDRGTLLLAFGIQKFPVVKLETRQ